MYQGRKILIVDDSQTERHVLSEMVGKWGFEIHEASNGEEGVKKAAEVIPDVILMDVVMPGLNGFQATREITKQESTKHIPVIMCTTKGADTDKLWGKRQGAAAYIVKPINKDELLNTIKQFLG